MGYLVITYDIPARERLRVGYRRLHSTSQFVYLSRYLYPTEAPYTINVPEGSYEVELTAVKDACGGLCGDPKVYTAQSYASLTTTTTSSTSSTTSTTSTSTTSSTTTTTTTIVPSLLEWDFFTNDPGVPEEAILTRTITISHNQDYTIPTTETTGLGYYIIKEPSSEPIKTKWFNTDINQGIIPDQVWLSPTYSGLYRYYKSRGLIAFNISADTKFIIS